MTTRLVARTLLLTVALLVAGAWTAQADVEAPVSVAQPVAPGCTSPTPTTAQGYEALWGSLDESEWGGADVSISVPLPDGRVVWLYGDTLSSGRFVHSTAIVQDGGCLHVSNGGAQLLPDGDAGVVYWVEAARVTDGGVLVEAEEYRLGDGGVWDFAYTGFTATALVTVDDLGDVAFQRWVSRERTPAADPGQMVVFGPGHFGYSVREHPWAVLASGETLTTMAQNFDDGKHRPPSAYRPLWFAGGEAHVRSLYR